MALTDEQLVEVKDAPRHFPSRPAVSTLWRWMLRGVAGIRLESVKVGGLKRYTSIEAIQRFIERTTCADEARRKAASGGADNDPPGERTPEQSRRLERRGLLPK